MPISFPDQHVLVTDQVEGVKGTKFVGLQAKKE